MVLIKHIGRYVLETLETTGRLVIFFARATSHCFRPPYFYRLILKQVIDIGYYSLPVVGLTTLFSGMVLAYKAITALPDFPQNPQSRLLSHYRSPES